MGYGDILHKYPWKIEFSITSDYDMMEAFLVIMFFTILSLLLSVFLIAPSCCL